MKKRIRTGTHLKIVGASLGIVIGAGFHTQVAWGADDRMDQLEKENQALRQRLDALEVAAQKQGFVPSGSPPPKFVSALSDISVSGFVTTSYFHDTSEPPGGYSPGYLWNRKNDSFSLNKFKLTLASRPVERSGDKFEVAVRASLIFGQDAPIVNSRSGAFGNNSFDDLREAYVEMNVPIGTGLNVRAGELISLLNYESGDGGAANNNFSQGFQWFFTGNGPSEGVQLGYNLTDWLDVKVRAQNGLYAGPVDNNASKTVVGAIGIKPTEKLWFSLIGFGGREDSFAKSVLGGSLLGGWQATEHWSFGTELDYFCFHNPAGTTPSGDSPVWSTGLWAAYDFCKQFGIALRTEYLSDKNGVDISGGALGFANAPGDGQDLASVALTFNYKPLPSIKIQPEVRFDHTSEPNGFGTKRDRVLLGAGISYLY